MRSHFQANPPNTPCPPGPLTLTVSPSPHLPSLLPSPSSSRNLPGPPPQGPHLCAFPSTIPSAWDTLPRAPALPTVHWPLPGWPDPVPCRHWGSTVSQTLCLPCPGAGLLASAPHSLRRSVPHCFSGPGPSCSVDMHEAQGAMSLSGWGGRNKLYRHQLPVASFTRAASAPPIPGTRRAPRRSPQRKHRLVTSTVPFTCPGPFWPLGLEGGASRGSWRRPGGQEGNSLSGVRRFGGAPRRRRGGGPGGASLQMLGLPPVCASRSQLLSQSCSLCPDSWIWGPSAHGHPANLCSFPLLTLSGEITPRTAPLVMPAPTRPVQRGRRPRPPRVPLRTLGRGSWGAGVPHGRAVSRTTWPLPGRVATRAAVPAVLDQALGARLSSPSSTRLCCDGHGRPPACSLS